MHLKAQIKQVVCRLIDANMCFETANYDLFDPELTQPFYKIS